MSNLYLREIEKFEKSWLETPSQSRKIMETFTMQKNFDEMDEIEDEMNKLLEENE